MLVTGFFFLLNLLTSEAAQPRYDAGGTSSSLLAIYGDGKGEIRVKNVKTRKLIKTFKIQINDIKGGLAIDYTGDIILFADDKRLFNIYLLDESGGRKQSGRGELFTNKLSNHFEVLLWQLSFMSSYFGGLSFDHRSRKFYGYMQDNSFNKICEISPINATHSCFAEMGYRYNPAGNFIMYNGDGYISFADSARKSIVQYAPRHPPPRTRYLLYGRKYDASSFTIDEVTKRLFFTQRSSVRVLDTNLTDYKQSTRLAMANLKIVMADSSVCKGLQAIAVDGNVAIWSSAGLKRLYVGKITNNFIPKQNVVSFDGSVNDEVVSRYILIVKHIDNGYGVVGIRG